MSVVTSEHNELPSLVRVRTHTALVSLSTSRWY